MPTDLGSAPADASAAPLEGLRIVEAGTFVAVPSGAMTLGMLGAEVIRIDPIGGASDQFRAPLADDGTSIYWASLNRGKRSVALDLRSEEGRELAIAIATAPGPDAGVFLTNSIGAGWFDDATLRARRADMITLRLTGYADGRPALDYTVNWEVGFPAVTGPRGSDAPTMHVLPAWDLLAGAHAAIALLGAERRRSRTGRGDAITLSLHDIALWASDALGYLAEVQVLGRGRERSGEFVYGTFGTAFPTAGGGSVMIVALTRRQWKDLIDVTDTAEQVAALEAELGVDLSDEHVRYAHRVRVRDVFAPWFEARDERAALDALRPTRLVASGLGTFEQVVADVVPQSDLFTDVVHPRLGALRAMATPARFQDATGRPEPVGPLLGAHTEQVLGEVLGLSTSEIGGLRDRRVIATDTGGSA
jgi:2-methylfumaryl-CoA isomerase